MIFLIIKWPNFMYLLVDLEFLSLPLTFYESRFVPSGWTPLTDTTDKETTNERTDGRTDRQRRVSLSVRSLVRHLDGVWHSVYRRFWNQMSICRSVTRISCASSIRSSRLRNDCLLNRSSNASNWVRVNTVRLQLLPPLPLPWQRAPCTRPPVAEVFSIGDVAINVGLRCCVVICYLPCTSEAFCTNCMPNKANTSNSLSILAGANGLLLILFYF